MIQELDSQSFRVNDWGLFLEFAIMKVSWGWI